MPIPSDFLLLSLINLCNRSSPYQGDFQIYIYIYIFFLESVFIVFCEWVFRRRCDEVLQINLKKRDIYYAWITHFRVYSMGYLFMRTEIKYQISVFIVSCWNALDVDWYLEYLIAHCVVKNSYFQICVLTSYGISIFQN